ncbi:MAG: FliI/YscN family ATPase [Pseudomonadota bacterium]
MAHNSFAPLIERVGRVTFRRDGGVVTALTAGAVTVDGLKNKAAIGDQVALQNGVTGEIVSFSSGRARVMLEGQLNGLRPGMSAMHLGKRDVFPSNTWIGRVLDASGNPLDDRLIDTGQTPRDLNAAPPKATARRALGPRLRTGLSIFDTLLPLVRGQRIGLFAGSGVGKSRLLAALAQGIEADVVVIGLIGERGREVREFVAETLGEEGLKRAVVVAATSDQPALTRMRAAYTMMAAAEYFRDQGKHVLLLADSITRFAEAQREVATIAGETASIGGFPASLTQQIMGLCERAGPGAGAQGDITAIMSVLVQGSDMEGPVADIMRGVLDGHVVLDRDIAERGRYPAINVLRSVSRSLPGAANAAQNALIQKSRQLLGAYDRIEMMLQAGLYAPGHDPIADEAVRVWPKLDQFIALPSDSVETSFANLAAILAPPSNDAAG